MEEGRRVFKILTEKRLLGRPSCIWEDNIRMDLKKLRINSRNWVDSTKDMVIGESL